MYRKVCHETGANTKEQVESVLTQCAQVKTDTARLGGFSPSQWVLGRAPRTLPSFASEEEHASLGATAARHDPSSTFALQHQARLEAQKAYAHLECSRRVQKALLRNAVPFDREFSVGDLVTFRRDNQKGGTSWSPVSRVIGHEGSKSIWLLCGNCPVLVSSHNVRVASPNEALAQAVLNGEPVVPFEVVREDGQRSFLDVRRPRRERERKRQEEETENPNEIPTTHAVSSDLPPVPEDDEDDWNIRPGIFDGEEGEEEDAEVDAIEEISQSRRRNEQPPVPARNVRPCTEAPIPGEPEGERGAALAPSRRESQASGSAGPIATALAPGAMVWPNLKQNLDDLPLSLREHFRRAGNIAVHDMKEARETFTCFLSQTVGEDDIPGKKVFKSINFDSAPPEVQEGLPAAGRRNGKFESFAAAIPVVGQQKADLLAEGQVVVPSKWVGC